MKNTNTKTLTRVALLVAIELVMKLVGLGSVPVGPLYMSFLTLPIAVGAITMGPAVGALLGGVFGAVSFYDAITGASAMTGALFQVSPLNTFILCVGMRVLMGLCCGLIFKGLQKLDKSRTWSYIVSAMTAPALNTLFFMGYIVLAFYGCDYVQNLVSVKGAANPFMFVVLLVGVQGVAEFLVSGILGGHVLHAHVLHPDIRGPAIQVLAELCPACLGVVCRGAVGAGDRHRFSEVLPDTLQQFCQRRVDEDRVAAVLAAELPHTEVRREGGAAVPGKRIRLQCHRAPPYSRFSSAAMGSA